MSIENSLSVVSLVPVSVSVLSSESWRSLGTLVREETIFLIMAKIVEQDETGINYYQV